MPENSGGWDGNQSSPLLQMYERMIASMEKEKTEKIVLFGSGEIGYEALSFLGDENIACFCDNDPGKTGKRKWGKRIISFSGIKTELW